MHTPKNLSRVSSVCEADGDDDDDQQGKYKMREKDTQGAILYLLPNECPFSL